MIPRTLYLTTLATALLVSTGCSAYTAEQKRWLLDGENAYVEGRYDQSIANLSSFLGQVKDKPETGRAYYVRGLAQARREQRAAARSDFQSAVAASSDAEVNWRAQVMLGTMSFEDEQWAAAAQFLSQAADTMPTFPPQDAVLYRLGLCWERLGRWAEAIEPYQRLVANFPASRYSDHARRHIELRPTYFAVQCGVYAEQRNADAMVAELKTKGLSAYVCSEPRRGRPAYVVLVGRHAGYSDARRELARVMGHVPGAVLWP
ncbi:Outer membrane protein assembly factor BamD [Phycisphaerae bacterium RAS1]|nr:Outer membrane protein assembly factor BamD [Phycisphaerae bacterium RAS1]